MSASVVALLAFAALGSPQSLPKVPKADASKLREQFTDALAGDEKAAKAFVATAKTLGKKHDFDSLLAALREGPLLPKGDPKPRGKGKNAEPFEQFDTVTTGFTFTVDKDEFRYAVDVPKGYEPDEPAPVILDPGHGSGAKQDAKGKAGFLGYFRHRAESAGLSNALIVRTEIIEQIGTDGVKGARPEDEVSAVFDAFFSDLCSRFAVDLDRVWVTGLSQTGFWSWQLGVTRADRFAGIAPMGAVTWGTNGCLPNLANLSVYVLHGDADDVCPVAQPRKTTAELKELGGRVHYEEIAGGKHDYSTWQHLDAGLKWLAEQPRTAYPKKIARNFQTLAQPWCYWIRASTLSKTGPGEAGKPPTAKLGAEIVGQEVRITSEGVKAIELCLSSELVNLSEPVVVIWNGDKKLDRVLERDFAKAAEIALEKCDWRAVFEASVPLRE